MTDVIGMPRGGGEAPIWADDFTMPRGATIDPSRWTADVGGLGWGDKEAQAYTDTQSNLSYNGEGQLVITARREEGAGGAQYTSARITTRGRFEFNHGRVEARVKIPQGKGIWPAFWLLGARNPWPLHGEIDIFEAVNKMARVEFNTHQPRSDGTDWEAPWSSPVARSGTWADEYHVYAVDWSRDAITWSIDGVEYATTNRSITPPDGRWVVDTSPQAIILNLAVGGYPGSPDSTTPEESQMLVDYVRVYPNRDTRVQPDPTGPEIDGSGRGAG